MTHKPSIPKFLLYDGQLRISYSVNFHLEMIPKEGTKDKVQGGGRVALDHEKKAILLYGISADFGDAKKEAVIKAIPSAHFGRHFSGYKVYWAPPLTYPVNDIPTAWSKAEEIFQVP